MAEKTTIGISKETHQRLDKRRAKGQSFDGFINELLDKTSEVEA
ncbi:MAG: DUF7557 family protein [archaeon]